MQTPKIRGQFIKKAVISPIQQNHSGDLLAGVGIVTELVNRLRALEAEVRSKVDQALSEIRSTVDSAKTSSEADTTKVTKAIASLKTAADDAVEHIKTVSRGEDGKNADDQAILETLMAKLPEMEQKLMRALLAQMPDENTLVHKVIKKIPENKASLKVIQERFEVDPMSVINQIMALPPEKLAKLKLGQKNISGLEQTMRAFQSQLGRGYLHGAGISEVIHDATLAGKGTTADPLRVIGGGTVFVDSEIVAGSGQTFTLVNVPTTGSVHLYALGQRLTPVSDYTIAGKVITTVLFWDVGVILADYRR